jgi:hypothetical protein
MNSNTAAAIVRLIYVPLPLYNARPGIVGATVSGYEDSKTACTGKHEKDNMHTEITRPMD